MFEQIVTTAQWPPEHCATLIASYQMGLDPQEALLYGKVKAGILDQMGINHETYHQCFKQERYPSGARPRVVAQRL